MKLYNFCVQETYENRFSINGSTGDIYIHSQLDRETDPHYEILVVAVDTGTQGRYRYTG